MIKVAPDVIRLRFRLCISNLHLVCIKDNFILTRSTVIRSALFNNLVFSI
jgi:hypothetical protein